MSYALKALSDLLEAKQRDRKDVFGEIERLRAEERQLDSELAELAAAKLALSAPPLMSMDPQTGVVTLAERAAFRDTRRSGLTWSVGYRPAAEADLIERMHRA